MEELSEEKILQLVEERKPDRISFKLFKVNLNEAQLFYIILLDEKSVGYAMFTSRLSKLFADKIKRMLGVWGKL